MKEKDLKLFYLETKHLFCRDMPKDIPIKITRANSYMGAAWQDLEDHSSIGIYIGKPAILENMKEFPGVVTWESIMLHEMCHIWQYMKLPKNDRTHSPRFMDKLRAIENLTGIPQFWDFVE